MNPKMEAAAQHIREHCLLQQDSLFVQGSAVWTPANLKRLRTVFLEQPDESKRTFWDKYHDQLVGERPEVIRLGAEVLAVYYLYPLNVRGDTKRDRVNQVLGWAGDKLRDDNPIAEAFSHGIINAGQGYNAHRPAEMGFLIDFMLAWHDGLEDHVSLLDGHPWEFQGFVDQLDNAKTTQMRHILLALFYPDYFEQIASTNHKRALVTTFGGLLSDEQRTNDDDGQLHLIRKRLVECLPGTEINFYRSPLAEAWREAQAGTGEGDVPLDLVKYQKQVVYYGPPGTGKTFQAKALAESIIRSHALTAWGASEYFAHQNKVAAVLATNIHRQQLHPAYGYEQFVRALHINNTGATAYRNGFLLDVVEAMNRQGQPGERLPHVVLLDEMNRTDLSRMLGECFSLLEDRNEQIVLAGKNDDGSQATLTIPNDLYVIGTMNLIDQSVEQIDFALRRRFLWIPAHYDPDALVAIAQTKWDVSGCPVPWDTVASDFQRLAAAGTDLNSKIHNSPLLGGQYEIGHTYLLLAVDFLTADLGPRPAHHHKYLYDGHHKPTAPLRRVWRLSLRPLLEQYLSGLDAPEAERELNSLERAFLAPRPPGNDEG